LDLVKKKLELKIDNKEYIMCFDMKSIATYKELTNTNFCNAIENLFNSDDETIIYFIASTLRYKDKPEEPLGKEVVEGDTLFFLLNLRYKVIDLVYLSLPINDSKKK
jgi:hypothetical protein